jgi:hypothetical protein
MSTKRVKSFFYTNQNKEIREKEMNDFLSNKKIIVDKILQSSTMTTIDFCDSKDKRFLDSVVVITIIYEVF